MHEGTNRTMVKIVDRSDGKVIREIPPEKMLDLVAKMWEVVGIFVDEKI
ncbi:MAG: flagellar protein FlaG [Bacillota bacterium]|nr:flagellar protein FlaG [Bacillota bacterium]